MPQMEYMLLFIIMCVGDGCELTIINYCKTHIMVMGHKLYMNP
jgi:hypothetical protein